MRTYRRHTGVVAVVVLALLATACPSSNDLDSAAKASNEMAHDLETGVDVVVELYKAKVIPLDAKDKIVGKIEVLKNKGVAFQNIVKELDVKYPQGTPPPQNLQFLRENVNELRRLYTDILADLIPFNATKALNDFNGSLKKIEKVVN